jgi:hypothetical protein
MPFRRTLCLALALLAGCDDDATRDEPTLDAGAPQEMADTLEAGSDAHLQDASEPPPALDATVDAFVAPTVDASSPDASADDAGTLDCSSLGLTYDNYGAEFIYLWCNFCHAKQEPTFTTPEDVRLWAPAMRIATLDTRSMPPSGNANYLRDNQRADFARWLDCGAP